MPKKLTRLLVAVALVLAVPIQAMAALGAGICMSLGHHDIAAAATHDPADSHGDHAAPAAASHEHEADAASGSAHCGPCVACCAAATISPTGLVSIPAAPDTGVAVGQMLALVGILQYTLYRPPLAL